LIAIQTRHHDVDKDDARVIVGDLGQGIETVDGRDHFTAYVFQQRFGGSANRLRIVDDHDLQGAGMLFHKCSTVAFANQIVRLPVNGGQKPLILKGQYNLAVFLAQSPTPIYRPTFEVVFP
jgi:hypothetical protein